MNTKEKLNEWKIQQKKDAFLLLLADKLDHDQYRVRLDEIDMIKIPYYND